MAVPVESLSVELVEGYQLVQSAALKVTSLELRDLAVARQPQ